MEKFPNSYQCVTIKWTILQISVKMKQKRGNVHMRKPLLVILSVVLILGGCGGTGTTAATGAEKEQETVAEAATQRSRKPHKRRPQRLKPQCLQRR